jgi:hypothetical protein
MNNESETSPCKFLLVCSMLDLLDQLWKIVVVVNSQKKLSQVGSTLVVVPEVRQQRKHSAALLFKVGFNVPELISKGCILHVFLLHLAKQLTQFLAH